MQLSINSSSVLEKNKTVCVCARVVDSHYYNTSITPLQGHGSDTNHSRDSLGPLPYCYNYTLYYIIKNITKDRCEIRFLLEYLVEVFAG